jgi:uncharacterized protein (TIGR00369 family)
VDDQSAVEIRFGTVPGLEYQRAILDGRLPVQPFQKLLGFALRTIDDDGTTIADVTPRAEFANSGGRLHGGYLSAIMDCVTASAAHATQPAGVGAPHIHAAYRFLESATHHAPLVAWAAVTQTGRSVIHVRTEVRTEAGGVVAAGETIHKVRSLRSSSAPAS